MNHRILLELQPVLANDDFHSSKQAKAMQYSTEWILRLLNLCRGKIVGKADG